MKTNMGLQQISPVANTLERDYQFIFDALKQLKEGTCCSHGDHEICSWNLLPRISDALHEHIAFEERWLFPKLIPAERDAHRKAHERLLHLLAKAVWELECGYGDQLRNLISDIEISLAKHHDFQTPGTQTLIEECASGCRSDADLLKIEERVHDPWSA